VKYEAEVDWEVLHLQKILLLKINVAAPEVAAYLRC
jgi:hypothetical protein